MVAVVAAESAEAALATWRALPQGSGAAVIGRVRCAERHVVLEDDALPRIC